MGVEQEQKRMFLTAFEQWEKEARSLFAAQYIAVVSECLCHLRAQYPILSPKLMTSFDCLVFTDCVMTAILGKKQYTHSH